MSDLIDRQAALDALIFDVRADRQNGKTLMVRYAEEVLKRIKALPSAQRWIPCSETPKEDGRYLVSVRILHKYNKVMISRFANGEFWDSDVVAWMPLPTPYREGGQNDGKN